MTSNSLSLADEGEFKARVFYFGRRPLTVFLAFLNAFVPLSMALYLPALPSMTEVFNTSRAMTDLTISGFMFCYGLSMLFWGGLSDKYGRKPILTAGLCLYLGASFICIIAQSIEVLILGRLLQAFGSGAIASVSMAIVKDTFEGRIMENTLAAIQTMTVVCPMVAPVLGAQLLKLTSWRGLFVALLTCALLALALSFALRETLKTPTKGGAFVSLSRIRFVLKDKGLRWLLFIFSISSMPFMAYLNSAPFIYIQFFELSPEEFSFFFSANAAGAMLGPLLYLRFFRYLPKRWFLAGIFFVMLMSGLLLLVFGTKGPVFFIAMYIPITIFVSSSRPVGTTLMMSQLDSDNGVVASLIGSFGLLCGSISMQICSLEWPNPVMPVSLIALIIGVICCITWLFVDSTGRYRDPVHD